MKRSKKNRGGRTQRLTFVRCEPRIVLNGDLGFALSGDSIASSYYAAEPFAHSNNELPSDLFDIESSFQVEQLSMEYGESMEFGESVDLDYGTFGWHIDSLVPSSHEVFGNAGDGTLSVESLESTFEADLFESMPFQDVTFAPKLAGEPSFGFELDPSFEPVEKDTAFIEEGFESGLLHELTFNALDFSFATTFESDWLFLDSVDFESFGYENEIEQTSTFDAQGVEVSEIGANSLVAQHHEPLLEQSISSSFERIERPTQIANSVQTASIRPLLNESAFQGDADSGKNESANSISVKVTSDAETTSSLEQSAEQEFASLSSTVSESSKPDGDSAILPTHEVAKSEPLNAVDSWAESFSQSKIRFDFAPEQGHGPEVESLELMTPQLRELGNQLLQNTLKLNANTAPDDSQLATGNGDGRSNALNEHSNQLNTAEGQTGPESSLVLSHAETSGLSITPLTSVEIETAALSGEMAFALNAVAPIEPLNEFGEFNIFAAISNGESGTPTDDINSVTNLLGMPHWSVSVAALAGASGWVWIQARRQELSREQSNGKRSTANSQHTSRAIQYVSFKNEPTVRAAYRWSN